MRLSPRIKTAIRQFALLLVPLASISPGTAAPSPALTNWQAALLTFQKAGALIGEAKYPQARADLSHAATSLAQPYSAMANQRLEQLEAALKLSSKKESAEQGAAFSDLCVH